MEKAMIKLQISLDAQRLMLLTFAKIFEKQEA